LLDRVDAKTVQGERMPHPAYIQVDVNARTKISHINKFSLPVLHGNRAQQIDENSLILTHIQNPARIFSFRPEELSAPFGVTRAKVKGARFRVVRD
jgi:hypothetical protein